MNQEFSDIEALLTKSLTGQISESEKQTLENWINRSPDHLAEYELLKEVWSERSQDRKYFQSQEMMEKVWQKGMNDAMPSHNSQRLGGVFPSYMAKIAASLLILFMVAFLLWQIPLKFDTQVQAENNVVTKSIPNGQKSKTILPDGSIVWLNAASTISYNENFSSSLREIELTGEAYFEVAKDSLRPFVVSTGNINTTAVGTSFNILAYEENDIRIALVTGRVKVDSKNIESSVYLMPGEGVMFGIDGRMSVYEFNPKTISIWKDRVLVLDGESFGAFKNIIEKWYGVTIKLEGDVPEGWSIRGRFENESLENMLKSISFNKNFEYELNNKVLTIKF